MKADPPPSAAPNEPGVAWGRGWALAACCLAAVAGTAGCRSPDVSVRRVAPPAAQVVFISTPHGGSGLAGGLPGRLARMLVRVPVAVKGRISRILADNRSATAAGTPLKPGSSLDSLTPRDPLIAALRGMPMRAGVGIHSVIGNRGRPGPLERSSDGVVPYTSSHLPQAQSEVVVPAGHGGTLRHPATAAEIDRILRAKNG